MLLRSKVAMIVMGIFLFYGIVDFGIQRFIIFPGFLALEQDEAVKDAKRVEQAINREIDYLDSFLADWSAWDDTYEFLETFSSDYIEANLPITTFTDNELNIIYFCDQDGNVIWGKIYDLETEAEIHIDNFPKNRLPKTHPLISYNTDNKPLSEVTVAGIYMTSKGPMITAARPIINSNNEGPVRGTLIMGRFLTPSMVKILIDQTRVDFKIFPVQTDSISETLKGILAQLTDKSPYLIETNKDADQMQIYTAYPDIQGNTALLIKSTIPRRIAANGLATIHFALLSIMVAGLGALVVILLVLHWVVLKPITRLTAHATKVKKTGDLSIRLSSKRQDEIGILANKFDDMLMQMENRSTELEEINTRLQEDIDKRTQAEEALWESEVKYRELFENSTDFVFTLDLKGNFTDVNKAAEDLTGYTKNELIGMNYKDYTPEATHEGIFEAFSGLFNKAEALKDFPLEVIIKDGSKRCFETCVSPLKKGDEVIGFQGSSRDITERKRAQEALQEQKERQANIIEGTNVGTWEWNVQTGETIFNERWAEIIGYKLEELSPVSIDTWTKYSHPDDLKTSTEMLRKHFSGELDYYDCECRMRHKDGHWVWILDRGKVISWNDDGKPLWMFGTHTDITTRKRMEEELLKNQKLESLGIFAGGIAHDFNNILTTILGNVSMAKDQAAPESQIRDLLGDTETALRRTQTLTKQLLTFAKGGAPVKETASLADIIKESSLFVMRGSKSNCEFHIAEDLWPVEIDVGQINQVINNVVINANQAMPEGGIIEITSENLIIDEENEWQLKPGRYIRMSVKDEGVGIAEKHLSKIFDPYFTTKQQGSGLGLATVYSIIKNHGGTIIAESLLGIGTTFHIYLPASEKTVSKKREDKVIKGRGRILVMDDEALLRKMLGIMLEKLGYESEGAKDGLEAIRMVKEAKETQKPYDAVILDLTVPGGMGGKEAIERLLELDPGIKGIVSSGYSDDTVLANFQKYGFKGIIPKPFESILLSKVLHEVLQSEDV